VTIIRDPRGDEVCLLSNNDMHRDEVIAVPLENPRDRRLLANMAFADVADPRLRASSRGPPPPCILPLPAETKPERLSVDGSPQPPRAIEPVKKHGAPSTGSTGNPNSRLGRKSSPHLQGRVMEQPATSPSFVGIDVSKDRRGHRRI
jgi:hypothetical protein